MQDRCAVPVGREPIGTWLQRVADRVIYAELEHIVLAVVERQARALVAERQGRAVLPFGVEQTDADDQLTVLYVVGLLTDDDPYLAVPVEKLEAVRLDDLGGRARSLCHVTHAYATTIHKAQGLTVDRTFLLGDDRLYREAGYVGLSRGRRSNHLYVVHHDRDEALELHAVDRDPPDPVDEVLDALQRSAAKQLASEERTSRSTAFDADVPVNEASRVDRVEAETRARLEAARRERTEVEAELASAVGQRERARAERRLEVVGRHEEGLAEQLPQDLSEPTVRDADCVDHDRPFNPEAPALSPADGGGLGMDV